MNALSLADALRAGAEGLYAHEAATGLIIAHGTWLARDDSSTGGTCGGWGATSSSGWGASDSTLWDACDVAPGASAAGAAASSQQRRRSNGYVGSATRRRP